MKFFKVFFRLILCLLIILSCSTLKKGTVKPTDEKNQTITESSNLRVIRTDKNDYYNKNYMRYEDYEYKDNIKTVNLFRDGFELSPPLLDINTQDKLKLEFDDLDSDVKNYKYYFIHCDADWKPSMIDNYEFETGFTEDFITDYKYSYNTRQRYTHYNLIFPNDNIKLIATGNYLLVIYIEDNKENIILTRRFWIVDPRVTVNATIKPATRLEDRNYKQEIDFSINKNSYEILNPYTDLKVIITQNWRNDNALRDIKPQIVTGDVINYNVNGEVTFNGGNEFRRFDIKSLKYNSERIRNITVDSVSERDYVTLFNDDRRTFKQYLKDDDINGRFLIKDEDNATDSEREGDYAYVHFILPYSAPLVDGELYIMGALTDWRFGKDNKMKYNYQHKIYEATLYLKQGYYNYEYVFLPNGANVGDESFIEGTHYETENEYTIFVYNREAGTTFDKLIGLKQISSLSY